MKNIGLLYIMAFAVLSSCSLKNDMMLPTDPAGIESFAIRNQVSAQISLSQNLITVTMPKGANLSALTVEKVTYLAATELDNKYYPIIREGDVLNLSDTLVVSFKSYRVFTWKLIAKIVETEQEPDPDPVEGAQLYNMSFDDWTKLNDKTWYPYAEDASGENKIWTSANPGISILGLNTTVPEESFVHGGKAARIYSDYKVKFAAGTLFTGEFMGLKGLSGAEIAWGVPFSERPKSLKGYFCYKPVPIDRTDAAHSDMKGQTDVGQIQVILADWDAANLYEGYAEGAIDDKGRFHVITSNTTSQFVDFENDPAIIAYANYEFSGETMENYEAFELEIKYRNDRTPKVVVIVCASSRYGDFFTGGTGSTLYVDDFSFVY